MTSSRILKSHRSTAPAPKLTCPTSPAAASGLRPNHPSHPTQQQTKQHHPQHQSVADGMGTGKENKHANSPEKPKCNNEDERSTSGDSSFDSLALSSSSDDASPDERRGRSLSGAKRLQYSNEEPHSEYDACNSNNEDNNDDDEEDDDICSECSGETVIANDFPPAPQNATQEEMNLYYWEVCYGDEAGEMMERAKRRGGDGVKSAPAKSCLSTKKMKSAMGTSITPRRLHPSPPGTIDGNLSTPNDDSQPNANKPKTPTTVKFGSNSAAEFDKLQPITEMTPMPSDVVQEIFPSESKEETVEEQQISRETAKNVAMLAEWDDLFDDDDLDNTPQRKRGKKRTPYKSRGRPQKSRRDSELFSRGRRSLLEDSDGEDDSHSGLPLCVAIDPEQYTSPSSVAPSELTGSDEMSKRDSISTEQPNRDSMDSACISPHSIRSNLGRETPNSARTSSSTILRAVHTSGAELPEDSPRDGGVLRPNQLNYGTGRSNSSPTSSEDSSATTSDNHSLGSDIMSLFTQHTIESESDADLFQRQLSILSQHPLQMLQLRIGDMAMMMKAMQKDPLKFLNEDVLRLLTPATALALVQDGESQRSLFSADILNKIIAANNNRSLGSFGKSLMATTVDPAETIASCVKTCHDTAMYEWTNHELAIAERCLEKVQTLANETEKETTRRHPKSKPNIHQEADKITALEEELVVEAKRLEQTKRAQKVINCNLELEKSAPIVVLSEDVRSRISPTLEPFTEHFNGYFTTSFLDGSAEVSMKIDIDHQVVGPGLSIKDGGSASKLLRAIFLGSLDSMDEEILPIRNTILSPLLETQDLQKDLCETSHLFLRIDSLCKSVKSLESEFLCSLDSECDKVHLSFSNHQKGEVIKVDFEYESMLAETWDATTVPNDVKVSVVSPEDDRDRLSNHLQQKARAILSSASHADPSLLHRIVNHVMLALSEANDE